MEMIQTTLLNYGVLLPDWLFWTIMAVVAVVVLAFFFFSKHIRKVTDKYDIPFDKVDGMVKVMASLAIRLYVLKRGVEEAKKVDRIKNIALTIDLLYPSQSSIRLSSLVTELEKSIGKNFNGTELSEHRAVIKDIQQSILNELAPVGSHVNDNEKDPIINPHEIATWIEKGVRAVDYVKR